MAQEEDIESVKKKKPTPKINAKQAGGAIGLSPRYNTYFSKVLNGELKTMDQWKQFFKKNNIV